MSRSLFDDVPATEPPRSRQRPGWERLRPGCGGVWRHVASGWLVKHCGHPTALWPYYAHRPGPEPANRDDLLLSGGWGLGYAHRTLKLAQAAVEAELAKETAHAG